MGGDRRCGRSVRRHDRSPAHATPRRTRNDGLALAVLTNRTRRLVKPEAVVVCAALAAMLLVPSAAYASLWLIFTPRHVSSGTSVSVSSVGHGDLSNVPAGSLLPVYLVSEAGGVTSSADDRLAMIGKLRVDASGDGHLRFVVTRLARGAYAGFILCAPCASSSAGRSFLPVAPGAVLDVSSDIAPSNPSQDDGSRQEIVVATTIGVIVAVAAVGLYRRRSRLCEQ
jgi:hypothetical protein